MTLADQEHRVLRARARITSDPRFQLFSGLLHSGRIYLADTFRGRTVVKTATDGWDVVFAPAYIESVPDEVLQYEVMHNLLHKAFQHFKNYTPLSWDGVPALMDVISIAECQTRVREIRDDPSLAKAQSDLLAKVAAERTVNEYVLGAVLDASVNRRLRLAVESQAGAGRVFCNITMPRKSPIEDKLADGTIYDAFHALKRELSGGGGSKTKNEDSHVFMDEMGGDLGLEENFVRLNECLSSLAASAASFGSETEGMALEVEALTIPKISWRERLSALARSLVSHGSRSRATWSRVNRRLVHRGIVMPTRKYEGVGNLAVVVDSSGSCVSDIGRFLTEVYGLLQQMSPSSVDLLWVDADVVAHNHLEPGQYSDLLSAVTPAGGGGTDMTAAWTYMKAKDINPAAVIVLTDGWTPWPSEDDVKTPVWWVINTSVVAPVGVTIHMEDSDRFTPSY